MKKRELLELQAAHRKYDSNVKAIEKMRKRVLAQLTPTDKSK